jgi:superfamily II DNA or RNA helicase
MDELTITKVNETYFRVDADRSILQEIKEEFTFDVPGAKFSPKYKMKVWDGKISLLNLSNRLMYMGLISLLIDFCKTRDYHLTLASNMFFKNKVHSQEVIDFVDSLKIHSNGEPLTIRPYQYAAIYAGILNKRRTLLSPTSSGKSLIIYCIIQWILQIEKGTVLLLVPTVGLVGQMYSDFQDYYNGDFVCQTISEGASKKVEDNIVISTWQSVFNQDAKWFNQFDGIIVDEVHTAQANSIRGIMENATDVHYRIGLTGTLNGSKTHELVITGLFGKISKIATTTELIEQGHVSPIEIKCLVMEYQNKDEQKLIKGADYQGEISYICTHEKRTNFIAKLALNTKGNTLILFNYLNHGEAIYNKIIESASDGRKVFLINGEVTGDERNDIRAIVEKEEDAIIVASYGTTSTGTNIKRIHTIIAASPTKSVIRLLQSIGRGLRLADDKDKFVWLDIVDDFSGGTKKKNFAFLHFVERLKIYVEQGFKYKIIRLKL